MSDLTTSVSNRWVRKKGLLALDLTMDSRRETEVWAMELPMVKNKSRIKG